MAVQADGTRECLPLCATMSSVASQAEFDRTAVVEELEGARLTFHRLVDGASPSDLERPSTGTRWNNRQLLFHMLIGYLVVWSLVPLLHLFSRLPPQASERYAALLNRAERPFNSINYWSTCLGAAFYRPDRMKTTFDRVIASLQRRVRAEDDNNLARGMHYPTRWDPFFKTFMTLADVYRYPTQHFRFHEAQLTLPGPAEG